MICVSDKKAVICKGDFHPAQLYKGEKKISGYSLEEFTGTDNVTLENCYNDRVYDAQITGKNLFNSNQLLQAEGWVENNGEYSGYIGKLYAAFYTNGAFNVKIPDNAKRICISFEGKNATKNVNTFSFQIYYTDGTSTLWVGVVNSTEWAEYKVKSVLGKTVESIKCGYNNSDTIYLRKIQITATEDYETYEPPLLDATITARGKNLFNIQSPKNLYSGTYGTCEKTEKGFKAVCTASANSFRVNLLIPKEVFEEGKKYCISCDGTNVRMIRVGEADYLNDTSSFSKYDGGEGTSCNFTISTITKAYISLYFFCETFEVGDIITVENIQIEEGKTVTEYKPYIELRYEPYIEPQKIPFENGELTSDIPTFKGTTVIEVESDIAVTARGKNLFNSNQLLQAEGWVKNNGEYSGYIGKLYAAFYTNGAFNVKIPDNAKRICISFEGKNATKNERTFSFQIYYTDGTSTLWVGVVNSTEWAEYKVKSVLGKTVESIKCGYNQADTIYLRKIQITATEDYETYEPFLLNATISGKYKKVEEL